MRATIESPRGGAFAIVADRPLHVRLVARSTSGAASEPSVSVGPLVREPMVAEAIRDGIVTDLALAEAAVTRTKLAIGAVDADRLAIGTGNLIPDPSFGGPYAEHLVADAPPWRIDTPGRASERCLTVEVTAAEPATQNQRLTVLPVLPGDHLYLAVDYRTSPDWDGSAASVVLEWLGPDGTTLGRGALHGPPGARTEWSRISGQLQAPDTAVKAAVALESASATRGSVSFDNAEARTVVIAGSVLARSIGTLELAAESITGEKAAAHTITGREIQFQTLTGDHLDVESARVALLAAGVVTADMLSADALNGKTISGGVIETAGTGQRTRLVPALSFDIASTYGKLIRPPGIEFRSSNPDEKSPGYLVSYSDADLGGTVTELSTPDIGAGTANIQMIAGESTYRGPSLTGAAGTAVT
nr:hypothetical protein [Streptomyces sp. SID5468]